MAREDTPLDQGRLRRDAGRAARARARPPRRRGPRALGRGPAYKAAHPEEAEAAPAPAGRAPRGRGRAGRGAAAGAAAPAAPAAAAAAVAVGGARHDRPCGRRRCPTGNIPTPKKGADDKHRLLALVPPEGIQRVEREQGDRVNVWPHLLIEEFVAMLILTAGLLVFSTFLNAPLRQLANPNLTPNPSKAPWYFLGLQELLRYFHPMMAGIVIPTFILVVLAAVPYVDRNPSIEARRPQDRDLDVHDPLLLRRDAHDHRLLLPRPRLQLDLAVGARGVLRPMTTSRSPTVSIAGRSSSSWCSTSSRSSSGCRSRGRPRSRRPPPTARPAAHQARCLPCPAATSSASRSLTSLARVRRAVRRRDHRVPVAEPEGRVRFGDQRRGDRTTSSRRSSRRTAVLQRRRPVLHRPLGTARSRADVDYSGASWSTTDGIMPLYQRCVHLGCRVPFCASSQWFECPCHGSKYNFAGEYQLGPAPRGMDRFAVKVDERQRDGRHVDGDPRTAAWHRHDQRTPAGTVLRGPGLGRGPERRHAGAERYRGGRSSSSWASCSSSPPGWPWSCAAASRASRRPTSRRRWSRGRPTPRSRRRSCRSCRGGASCSSRSSWSGSPTTGCIEPSTNLEQEKALRTEAIERGRRSVELFSEENQLGVGCVRCHGPELRGGVIPVRDRMGIPAEPDHDLRRAVDRPPAHQVGHRHPAHDRAGARQHAVVEHPVPGRARRSADQRHRELPREHELEERPVRGQHLHQPGRGQGGQLAVGLAGGDERRRRAPPARRARRRDRSPARRGRPPDARRRKCTRASGSTSSAARCSRARA